MTSSASDALRSRIASVDWLRGLVMVVMLLDHARDFLHHTGLTADPMAPATTSPGLYLTRWVTHLCAPTFVFLAGVSVYLQLRRGKTKGELSRYLLTRGLFLVALELAVIRWIIFMDFDASFPAFLQVIWVTGWGMVALAGLIHAPTWAVALFGGVQVLGHNLLDGIRYPYPADQVWEKIWAVLHQKNGFELWPGGPIGFVQYPLIPWLGVIALGFVAGRLFDLEPARRRRLLTQLGLGALAGFLLLRWSNLYGNPRPWAPPLGPSGEGLSPWRTVLSFFHVEKYPPSLLFLAMTLGISLLLLAWVDGRRFGRLGAAIVTFGRVPLFFYVLQWPVVHLTALLFQVFSGQPLGWQVMDVMNPVVPPGAGFGLPAVYLGWVMGLVVLYPLCCWYAGAKKRGNWVWLSYL